MRAILAVLSLVVLALTTPAAADVAVTTCGTVIPEGETGILANDLDCTNQPGVCIDCVDEVGCFPGTQVCQTSADCSGPDQVGCAHAPAVSLRKDATLDMNDHAIDGGPNCVAIRCLDARKHCTITSSVGRGDVTGAHDCIVPAYKGKLSVSNVDVHDCQSGIMSGNISARIEVTNVTANGHAWIGIRGARILATNVTANGNGFRGISAEAGKLEGSTIEVRDNGGNGAVSYKRFKLDGFVATGNGFLVPEGSGSGIWALKGGSMSNSTLSGNVYQDAGGPIPTSPTFAPLLPFSTAVHSISQLPAPVVTKISSIVFRETSPVGA